MHLLAATPGTIDDGTEPVDLGQTPADLLILSAADTELAALSAAREAMDDAPSLRLASLLHLRHPMSVDLHIEQCASRCRLGDLHAGFYTFCHCLNLLKSLSRRSRRLLL